jgi:hypothetical protein
MLVLARMSRRGDRSRGAAHGRYAAPRRLSWTATVIALSVAAPVSADVFDHLQSLSTRSEVGDPSVSSVSINEGPKGIAAGDFNGDSLPDLATSNLDGSVSVLLAKINSEALSGFVLESSVNVASGSRTLRGLAAGDFNGDGVDDLIAAAPYEGRLHLFVNGRTNLATKAIQVDAWVGVRAVEVGDFDGDGIPDVAAAGPNLGVRIYRGLGNGLFEIVQEIKEPNVESLPDDPAKESPFPGPHYVLRSFRWPDNQRDSLVVAHVSGTAVWKIEPTGSQTGFPMAVAQLGIQMIAHDMEVAALGDGEVLSLVVASKVANEVNVFSSTTTGRDFSAEAQQRISISNGPRAVRALDVTGDGKKDLAVAVRDADHVAVLRGEEGRFVLDGEYLVGRSPRALAVADWNLDGAEDLAVINRVSEDVSVLVNDSNSSGFLISAGIVPVEGEIADLQIADIDGDGFGDVLLLMRGGGDLIVLRGSSNGPLSEPVFYPTGFLPSQMAPGDFNEDGLMDVCVALLIDSSRTHGALQVRLGEAGGTLGEVFEVTIPAADLGKLLSVDAADFDGDGHLDLVAAYGDARASVFQGIGNGFFLHRRTLPFANSSRDLAAADFDGDGDIDFVGAGYYGDVVLWDNTGGDFEFQRRDFAPGDDRRIGSRVLRVLGEPTTSRLLQGTNQGIYRFAPEPALFGSAELLEPTVDDVINGMATGDFDADGEEDIAYGLSSGKLFSGIVRIGKGRRV